MAYAFGEGDWKVFRRLHPIALGRFCEQVLGEVGRLASEPGMDAHQRYVAVYKLIQDRDRKLAQTFDDLRRSIALERLAAIRARGLLTEEEFGGFSEEAREAVAVLLRLGTRG